MRLARETAGLFLGAMPPEQFLNEFLPISTNALNALNCPDDAFANVVPERTERTKD
jgi:hypothetical protein